MFCSSMFFLYFFSSGPILSDDAYRFWWDGLVQVEFGMNPYTYAPSDFPGDNLGLSGFERMNHSSVPTVYGPFLQFLFYLSYLLSPSMYGMKFVLVLFELGSVFVLILLLRGLSLPSQHFVMYALNPLVFLEMYSGMHTESVLVFFLLLVLYFRISGFLVLSLLFLAFLTLTKYLAIMFLPLYFMGFPLRRVAVGFFLYFVILFSFYFIYFDSNMFTALINYSSYWEFNGFVYNLGVYLLGDSFFVSFLMGFMFLLGVLLLYMMYFSGNLSFMGAVYFLLFLLFMLSPVLYPWYFVMFLPLLSMYFSSGMLLFSGLVVLSYMVLVGYYASGRIVWELSFIILLCEYLPFYFLLVYDLVKVSGSEGLFSF